MAARIFSDISRIAQDALAWRKSHPPMSLRQNFAWTLWGSLIYSACQWGVVVAIAKLSSPEMVGRFTLGLAVTAPVMMLANLQLRSVQVTDARDEYPLGEYVRLRLLTILAALAVIAGLVLWSGYAQETAWVVVFIGIAKCAESMSDVIYGAFQKRERMDLIAISLVIRSGFSLAAMAVVLYFTAQVLLATAAFAATWLAALVLYDVQNLRNHNAANDSAIKRLACVRGWHWRTMLRLARLALPLGIVMMLISLNVNLPRYFLERFQGERALGYFAAMSYVALAANIVVFALGQSASTRLAQYYIGDRAAFRRLLVALIALAGVLGALGVLFVYLFGSSVLSALYGRDYAGYAEIFIWLMLATAVGFIGSIFGYALTAMRIFNAQITLFAVAGMATFAVCWLFIPVYGMHAAAWALLVSAIIQTFIGGGLVFFVASKPKP